MTDVARKALTLYKVKHARYGMFLLFIVLCFSAVNTPTNVSADAADRAILKENVLDPMPTDPLPKGRSNYISLMNNASPPAVSGNSRSYADRQSATEAYFKVYAMSNAGSKTVTLRFVNRDVGQYACQGYRINWDLFPLAQNEKTISGPSVASSSIPAPGASDCNLASGSFNIPFSSLQQSSVEEHKWGSEGLKVGILRLTLEADISTVNASPTFKIDIGGGARIGFAGRVGGFNPEVAVYPTNLYNDQTIGFEFMPPCDTPNGRQFSVRWSDDDRGVDGQNQDVNSNFVNNINFSTVGPEGSPRLPNTATGVVPGAKNGLTASIYRNYSSWRTGDAVYSGSGGGGRYEFTHTTWSNYELRFTNVTGGNRIVFEFPFDSADQSTSCGFSSGGGNWQLGNSTKIDPGIGGYSVQAEPTETDDKGTSDTSDDVTIVRPKPVNYWPGRNCTDYSNATNRSRCNSWNLWYRTNRDNARDAYQNARFQHSVENQPTSKNVAKENEHQSFIQYRLKRASSSTWRNSQNNDTCSVTDSGPCAAWERKSTNQSESLPARGSFYINDDGTSQYSIPRSDDLAFLLKNCNTGNACASSADGPREPTTGDTYCERVVTTPFRMVDGALSGTIASSERCVTLGTPTPRECFAWQVRKNAYVDGPRDSSNAWVGDTFYYRYEFSKSGPRKEDTPTINFNLKRTGSSDDASSRTLGVWEPSYSLGPIGVRSGGETFTSSIDYNDDHSRAPDHCSSEGNGTAGPLSVTVPYYFHIKTDLSSIGNSTEQGQSIEVDAKYNMPDVDASNGRGHTWTDDTNYKITRLINPSSTDTSTLGVGADVCAIGAANCAIVNQGNKGHLDPNGSANTSLGTYTNPGDTVSGTGSLAVGTKVCFVSSINKPSHDAGAGDWGHSVMRCTTIVKRPKVQFRNADLTVGRPIEQSGGQCDQTKVKNNAIVQATGANAVNPFGSWIEYGVFATGDVTGFGSAATPFGAGDMYKRLTFANTTTPGNYSYSSPCVSNVFDSVSGNLNTITASTIRPGDYFAANTDDKNGYVTNIGKDLTIGEPDATGGPGGGGGSSATTNNTYVVQQCSSWTNSVPAGWSYTSSVGQANSKSGGCDDNGNYLKLWLSAPRNQGEYSKWTFTAPSGTNIQRLQAYRIIKAGGIDNYRGSWTQVGTDGTDGNIEYCTNYAPYPGLACSANAEDWSGGIYWTAATYGDIDKRINDASSMSILVDCRVDRGSAAIYYSGRGGADIECPGQGDTSYSIKNIKLTLKDTTSPGITVQNTGLKTTLPTQKISGTQNLTFTANDTGSGVYSYSLTASGPDSKTYTGYIDTASSCTSGTITIPQPCASSKSLSIPVDTTQLQFGNYDFSLSITDRSGNSSGSTNWKAVIDNRALLGADYNAFKNRNVVVYARKDPSKGCSDPTSGGNLTISTNISYSNTGYAKISELPRVMFLADCNIIIDDSVTEVSAWLVAKNNVMTCSVDTFNKFRGAGGSPKPTQSDCNKQLVVNGAVQANKLLLMRTNGSDLTDAASRANSAEVFNLRTDQVLSTWAKGRTSGTPRTVYQADIPPQY